MNFKERFKNEVVEVKIKLKDFDVTEPIDLATSFAFMEKKPKLFYTMLTRFIENSIKDSMQ